jgi:hypothetical protein
MIKSPLVMLGLAAVMFPPVATAPAVSVAQKHVIAVDTYAVVDARLAAQGLEPVECGGGGACLPRSLEQMGDESLLRARLAEFLLTQRKTVLENTLFTGQLRNDDGVPHATVEGYLEHISNPATHLGEFEISMIAEMTNKNISVMSIDEAHDKFFSGGIGATVTICVVYYPEGQYGDKSAGHYRGYREMAPWLQVPTKKQKQKPSGNVCHAEKLAPDHNYAELLLAWKANVELNRVSEQAAAAQSRCFGHADSFGLLGGVFGNESDSTMQVDAPAHNPFFDQLHGVTTAPAPSAPLVAPAHGAPHGQPHGAPDCASGSGSDVPVYPAPDASDLSDATADDKKRKAAAAKALALKKRRAKAALGLKQAAEKDKEEFEKQYVVLGAMENGDIDGKKSSFSTEPGGIGLAYVKEETIEASDSTSDIEDKEGGDDEDNDEGFSDPWECAFVGGTAASPAVSQGNGTHGDKSTAWQSEFVRSHE